MSERSPPLMPLTVARTVPAAVGIHAFELVASGGKDLPPFTPGAHVTVQVPNGLLRKYSLANDCGERHRYLIAVKREAAGRGGSASLVDACGEGAVLPCSAPHNDFELSDKAKEFLFIAGGIGITPIMSMVRHLALRDGRRFKLHYLTRSPEETAFRDELRAPPFAGNVAIHQLKPVPPFLACSSNCPQLGSSGPSPSPRKRAPSRPSARRSTARWTRRACRSRSTR